MPETAKLLSFTDRSGDPSERLQKEASHHVRNNTPTNLIETSIRIKDDLETTQELVPRTDQKYLKLKKPDTAKTDPNYPIRGLVSRLSRAVETAKQHSFVIPGNLVVPVYRNKMVDLNKVQNELRQAIETWLKDQIKITDLQITTGGQIAVTIEKLP